MQCVKLRSVMGSYLNIHLSLFPIYVLLLLLTLSHGRPSAKVRETRDELLKSPQQQFRETWAPNRRLPTSPPSTNFLVNSVSNEITSVVHGNSQPLSHLQQEQKQQVNPIITEVTSPAAAAGDSEGREEVEEATSSSSSRSYGSGEAVGTNSHFSASELPPAYSTLATEANPQKGSSSSSVESDNAFVEEEDKDMEEMEEGNDEMEDDYEDVLDAFSSISNDYEEKSHVTLRLKRAVSNMVEEPQSNNLIVQEEEKEESSDQFGSQQELGQYRQSILNSIGHYQEGSFLLPSNSSINNSHMDTLTKYNITKEEYLEAYTEYMLNVKKRREANREIIGVKDRRKKAVTISKTYHDNGTDLFSIGSKVLRLFRFDIQYTPRMEGTDVRIQRVVLNLPAVCQLTGHVRNSTNDLPDLREISEMAQVEEQEKDCVDGNETSMTQVDLTRNVTSWSIRSRTSSPFIVMAICTRDGASQETPVSSSASSDGKKQQQHPHRHGSHHGGNLKMVTKEFLKPSYTAQLKRRARRAASSEPSTLRSFNHKRDMGRGRECANTRHGKTCCRRSLKIKFSDLGISDVILEPQEFDAHICDGRCNARRVAYASTHAMFQHILHQTKGKKFAPRPCCVPTALSELDVLHVDPNGNRNGGPKLIVTILKDAIVKECGCS